MKRCCGWSQVNRAGYYRWLQPAQPDRQQMELRSQIQKIAVQWPSYGYRRVTRELRDNLRLSRKPQARAAHPAGRQPAVSATQGLLAAHHQLGASLAGVRQYRSGDEGPADRNQPAVGGRYHYIRLELEYVYLAVVLDAYSRRVVGWALGRTLEAELALAVLRMAVAERRPGPGLVHHSDRGVQYACAEYRQLLAEHGIRGSMSRAGNPYDNALAESFIKTLKYEEVYRNHYRDMAEAQAGIAQFIEEVYNEKRLHSALDYRSPAAFERGAA